MKFLITGITGFAGPHLANLLHREGHKVYGLVRHSNGRETDILDVVSTRVFNDITFLHSDLTNFRTLKEVFANNHFDGVFHLAAQSHPPTSFTDPLGTMESNVIGSANLIQAIIDTHGTDCKMMFCSTSEVYGNLGADGKEIHWESTLFPANPYGASKAATDLYMQERIESGALQGFITRAFSHTGPRRGKNFSISSDAFQIAQMMKEPEKDHTLLVGNLQSVRVVMDVRDCVNAYYKLMMADTNGGIYNVCGDKPHEMKFFTDMLVDQSALENVKYKIHEPFWRPIDIHYQNGDTTNLKEVIDWEMEYTIERTMMDLLDYWSYKL